MSRAKSCGARVNNRLGLIFPVLDDELAELDETLELVFTSPAEIAGQSVTITILDDDRKALLEVTSFGADPTRADDQTAAFQAAIDAAGQHAPSVVLVAPGNYLVAGLTLPPE